MYSQGPGDGDREPPRVVYLRRRQWLTKRDGLILGVLVAAFLLVRLFGSAGPDWHESYPGPVGDLLSEVTAEVPTTRDPLVAAQAISDGMRNVTAAVERLGSDRGAAVEPLMALAEVGASGLTDNQPRMDRARAIFALGLIGSDARDAAPLLLSIMADPTEEDGYRSFALGAVIEIGAISSSSVPVILEVLRTADTESLRVEAVDAIAAIGPGARPAVPDLVALLRQDEPRLRQSAAAALAAIGPAAHSAIPALISALGDDRPFVRASVIQTLGSFGSASAPAVDALIGQLSNDQPGGRVLGPEVLQGEVGEIFNRVLEAEGADPDIFRRVLEAGDGPGAIQAVRVHAARALGEIGPLAADAIPALTEVLDDENERLREVAAEALTAIRGR